MELHFPLILDGATGTELQKRGYTGDVCAEQWTLEHPEAIIDIQRGYVDSGSQVLYTPTFGANRRKLEEHGIFNRTEEYNRRLAALSEQASGGRALRAGDISPTGAFLAPLGDVSFEELVGSICSGPAEQFRPKASMPMPCSTTSAAVTSPPEMLRPFSSQVKVTKIGLSLPQIVDGKAVYDCTPEEFVALIPDMLRTRRGRRTASS